MIRRKNEQGVNKIKKKNNNKKSKNMEKDKEGRKKKGVETKNGLGGNSHKDAKTENRKERWEDIGERGGGGEDNALL